MFFSLLSRGNSCYGFIFLVAILPFIFIPSVFSPYESPKFFFYIGAVFLLGSLTFYQAYKQGKSFISFKDTIMVFLLLYFLAVILANLYGIDPQTSMRGSPIRHQGLLLLFGNVLMVLSLGMQKKEEKEKLFFLFQKGMFVSTFLLCFFSLWQAAMAFIFQDGTVPLYQGRIVGTFGNPNFLGGYLVMVLPFLLFSKKRMFLRMIVISMIVIVIFLTGSRAAILALGIVLFLAVPPLRWNNRFMAAAFAILVIVASFGLFQLRESQWDNRSIIWQGGWEAFLRRPILGYGQENFTLAFTKVKFFNVDNAHNIFLEVAVSSGIVSLFSFLALLFYAFNKAPAQIKISLLAFLIVAQFNPLSIAQIALFWFLIGLL